MKNRVLVIIRLGLLSVLGAGCGAGNPSVASSGEPLGHGYIRRGEYIHFEGPNVGGMSSTRIDRPPRRVRKGLGGALNRKVTICQAPDAASFEALSEEYTRDKNRVYYKWISPGTFLVVELPQADVATFRPINFTHAVDTNRIWYLDQPIPASDPATAELIDNRIIKDANRVYISGVPQAHLDAKTFKHSGSGYFLDAHGVYWGSEPVEGADRTTFTVLGDSFMAVDQNSVYRSGQPQPHLDSATCKFILHDPYGYQVVSDKNGVYLNGLKFLHADPDDFTVIDNRTARGGKYVFLIDTWHSTPVTLYRDGGQLVAETVLYAKGTANGLATIRGEVDDRELKNVTLSAPPGEGSVEQPVPKWQRDLFTRPDIVERMNEAGALLK